MHFLFLLETPLKAHLKCPLSFKIHHCRAPWALIVPCAAAQSSMCDTPTAQCRRQGGLVKCYFYPEYLNSDDCDGVFDVTRSSRQNTDYSLELVRTSGKFFPSHSFHFRHLWRGAIMQLTRAVIQSVSSGSALVVHSPTIMFNSLWMLLSKLISFLG